MSIIQGNSKSSAAGYSIDQSIRFNDNDSASLTRTPGSAGNRRTWTFSCWVKRANLTGANQPIFSAGGDDWLMFLSAETLGFNTSGSNYRIVTSQLFRDPGAWFHLVLRVDTTNATAGDRLRLYINGSEVTDFGTDTNPTLNFDTAFNNTGEHRIGKLVGASQFFDGYLAEINHVDGSSLAPTEFGETDADTGQWVPVKYTGSYGTNGFYITGANSADLGADDSGNGNNFTSSGLAAADQVSDSPTDNYGVMNPLDNGRPSNITLSDGNLTAAFAGSGYSGGIRSSIFFDSEDSDGWYAECTLDSLAFASVFRAGVANASLDLSTADAQTSADGWAYSDQGAKLNNSYTTGYGSSVGVGDVVGIAVRNGKIYFAVNNTWQGSADPVTESNPAFSNLIGDVAFCQSTNTGGSYAHTATWNFGQKSFAYTPPTGYKTVSADNLPLSNGDLSAFVWIKNRDAADNHMLFDAVRGVTKDLHSNSTAVEATNANTLTRFLKNGFEVSNDAEVNTSGESYVAWQWLNDSLSTSSNTDGTVTSTVNANTTSGFSIAKWTHTTASNYTVGHGLGAVPKMILVKTTDQGTNWGVYHSALTVGNRLLLNSTSAQIAGYWGANSWTSSTFSIGSARDANGSTMVAYSFAEVDGFSKFGSYTGNGSTDGPFIYTGFKPRFVMMKRYDSTESWPILDTARGSGNFGSASGSGGDNPTAGNDLNAVLVASTTAAEEDNPSGSRRASYVSNGFKVRTTNTAMNASGGNYIYMAFAESPFKTATAR